MEQNEIDPYRFSKEVIEYFNMVRSNPKKFSSIIREYKQYFKGKVLRVPNSKVGIMTKEGADAFEEAAKYLDSVKAINTVKYNVGLTHVAKEVVDAAAKTDDINSLDELDMDAIFEKYGKFVGAFSRAMDFGSKDSKMVIINLIVCDGDSSRGQREGIFNSELKEIGVWTGKEKTYGQCTSIATATKFTTNSNVDDIYAGESEEAPQKKQLKTLDQKLKSGKKPQQVEEGDDELPPGVKSIDRTEKIVVENGKKKKITKIVRHMEDGSTETETEKETIE